MEQSQKQRIAAKLDELSEIQAAVELTRLDYEAKRAEILKAVQSELDALDAEYNPLIESSTARGSPRWRKKSETMFCNTVQVSKGVDCMPSFTKGASPGTRKSLIQYAAAHPEITPFRKQGNPSVSLRTVQEPDKSVREE